MVVRFVLWNYALDLFQRAFLNDNLKVELQRAQPFEQVGVHASACQPKGNQVHRLIVLFVEAAVTNGTSA
jgi:hypothetical protein